MIIKSRKNSESQMVLIVPIFITKKPKKAKRKRKSNICFEEKPLFPRYLVHKTIPVNENAVKIEYRYQDISSSYQKTAFLGKRLKLARSIGPCSDLFYGELWL
ncbi:hypothetical protein AMJ48_00955 [Parcubacteria bacterium DG_74_1]|nr:MAG: hypothetical protein AMJ48_00955 [Parcubacteria bacterium DG_74_1]